jgi:Ca2+ transporting ATPase
MVMENFEDKTIQILCFAAIASLVLGIATHGLAEGWLEGVSIILAVLIITVVTSGNNYMKEKQFRKLNEVASRKNVNVVRAGNVVNTSVFELMVGDIVQIETGEIISVDGLVVKANRLSLDESAMTGETNALKKEPFEFNSNRNCFLTSGTKVVEGTGQMMVLAVGKNTVENQLKAKLQQDDDLTPLQEKLADLADQIGKLGMYSAALTFAALVLHLLYDCFLGRRALFSIEFLDGLIEYFIIAVSIIVIAVPEGLPLAVTISLAYSVGKMREENNLVRFLAACETMGGANNICSDKTGTLTKNQMTVTRLWAQNRLIESFDKTDRSFTDTFKDLLSAGIALNSDAQPKVSKTGVFEQIGNKTECALIEMSYKLGNDFREIRKSEDIISTVPFSSERKRMSVICKLTKRNKYYIFSKGAPEILVDYCSKYIDKNGEVASIDEQYRQQLKDTISQFASASLRTILLCYQELSKDIVNTPDPEKLERDLIVLGLTGIKDPLKESVPEAVLNCKKAGIIVRMVTGDNTETAVAIAKDAHIIPSDYTRPSKGEPGYYIAMEGKEFRTLVEGLIPDEK